MSTTTHSVEDIKAESHRLRGSLLESLADPVTGALREDDQTLISTTAATSRTTATSATNAVGRSSSRRTSS